jgi:hypothetical protein
MVILYIILGAVVAPFGNAAAISLNESAMMADVFVNRSADLATTSSDMEATLAKLMIASSGFAATPMGDSVKQIEKQIKNMKQKVIAAHNRDQKKINSLGDALAKCGRLRNNGFKAAELVWKEYSKYSKLHKKCREIEAVKLMSKIECKETAKALKGDKDLKCKTFNEISRKWATQKDNVQIMKKAGGESDLSYITRISTTICGKHIHGTKGKINKPTGGWGGGLLDGALDIYLRYKEGCAKAKEEAEKKAQDCTKKDDEYTKKKSECDQFQDIMDNSACKRAVMMKDTCERYTECYYSTLRELAKATASGMANEIDRKAEWRGLQRMDCLMGAFADGKVSNEEVNACKKTTVDTDLFKLKKAPIAKLPKCDPPHGELAYPSNDLYKKHEFASLPTLAKGKEPAECSAIEEVSLKPREGSPKDCKCFRVVLGGHYSAGALVMCSKCLDVHRSLQKNSCPVGTKIFSPRSRSDWKNFLASAGPLRDPNWIIDITRPQNGCGGCQRHAMNSGNKAQQTWQTSDGSPWWLRSTTYGEPNGDYNANCYLNLGMKNPEVDTNKITFNDHNCNYHSKSYYCQKVDVNLAPRKGSPESCKCYKIELSGSYSPGSLIKCKECLSVSKSKQKNSCPIGMKIFSPRSEKDWKTFLTSAGPLAAPHWIVDVTRPQNGCGGCKRYPMKSTTAQQATWKTSDGSKWWLRSTPYGEPNGDYHANCYLNMKHPVNSASTLRFNDWNCNYHSRSYYCQPIKGWKEEQLKKKQKKEEKLVPKLACPDGTILVGGHNADVRGCGLQKCNQRYDVKTAEACHERCLAHSQCKSFTWAPLNGDKNHKGQRVCSMYKETQPSDTWGPNQVFCRAPPKPWYCVASASRKIVTGPFSTLADAKKELNKRKGSSNNRQMICEMSRHGGAKADPHKVGGENQGGGSKAGFEKWWYNWNDIRHMNSMCNKNKACNTRPKPESCNWTKHGVQYSGGYAGGVSTKFSLKGAKDKCTKLGSKVCKAVTCDKKGKCTVRKSSKLTKSPYGETTYVPSEKCY